MPGGSTSPNIEKPLASRRVLFAKLMKMFVEKPCAQYSDEEQFLFGGTAPIEKATVPRTLPGVWTGLRWDMASP